MDRAYEENASQKVKSETGNWHIMGTRGLAIWNTQGTYCRQETTE